MKLALWTPILSQIWHGSFRLHKCDKVSCSSGMKTAHKVENLIWKKIQNVMENYFLAIIIALEKHICNLLKEQKCAACSYYRLFDEQGHLAWELHLHNFTLGYITGWMKRTEIIWGHLTWFHHRHQEVLKYLDLDTPSLCRLIICPHSSWDMIVL